MTRTKIWLAAIISICLTSCSDTDDSWPKDITGTYTNFEYKDNGEPFWSMKTYIEAIGNRYVFMTRLSVYEKLEGVEDDGYSINGFFTTDNDTVKAVDLSIPIEQPLPSSWDDIILNAPENSQPLGVVSFSGDKMIYKDFAHRELHQYTGNGFFTANREKP